MVHSARTALFPGHRVPAVLEDVPYTHVLIATRVTRQATPIQALAVSAVLFYHRESLVQGDRASCYHVVTNTTGSTAMARGIAMRGASNVLDVSYRNEANRKIPLSPPTARIT